MGQGSRISRKYKYPKEVGGKNSGVLCVCVCVGGRVKSYEKEGGHGEHGSICTVRLLDCFLASVICCGI